MTLFITGGFGNIGRNTIDALLAMQQGHEIRALSADAGDAALIRTWGARVKVIKGDLRAPQTWEHALTGVDVVIHLAFVIPPAALEDPQGAEATNVGGTRALLDATKRLAPNARFLFASSMDVFGDTTKLDPPRRVTDPVSATDPYVGHKILCEQLVRESGLTWGIVRFADVPPMVIREPVPMMFEIPLAQRIEALHPLDAGLAAARAATSEVTWGKVWLLGGGKSCQVTYGEYINRFFEAFGMGEPLPAEAFTTRPYCTDWLDTDESQRVFQYQRHSFADIVRDLSALLGWRRPFTALARPFVRRQMLKMSPYLKRRG